MNIGIYKILNKVNNKVYIGSATSLRDRFNHHLRHLRKNKHHNIHLQRAFNKYGEENFEFIIIEYCDKLELLVKEQHYLDTIKDKYNINPIANSQAGRIVTEETRKKLSISSSNRVHTEETKRKIAAGQINRKILKGENHPNWGKTFSDEVRKNMSNGLKKWNRPKTHAGKKVDMLDKNTNELIKSFRTVRDAAKYLGKTKTSCSTIIKVCKNKPSCFTAFGYKWKYSNINEED